MMQAHAPGLPYRRRMMSGRAYAIPVVLWVAAGLWLLFGVAPGGATTFNIVISIVAPGMIFGVWLLTVWSIDRYGAMTITRDDLRVGRTRVPIAILDVEWLEALARTKAPAGFEKFARSAGAMQVPGLLDTMGNRGRYIGGSFGTPLGAGDMTLRKTNGELITMPVKDQAEALTALLEAVAASHGG